MPQPEIAPEISVVSVTRNDLAGIQRTRASLLLQTGVRIQHIVVDGASTDGTVEWLQTQDWRDGSTFVSAPDRGIYDAMNKGAALATGELIVFLNGGDRFTRDTTARDVLRNYRERQWQWAYGVTVLEAPDGSVSRIHQMAPFSRVRLGLGLAAVPHQATWMRTEFFHRVGDFELAAGLSADMEHCWRASALADPHVIPEVLAIAEEGGVSAHQSPGYYARAMRRNIKRRNDTVLGNPITDALASGGVTAVTASVQVLPRWWSSLRSRGN